MKDFDKLMKEALMDIPEVSLDMNGMIVEGMSENTINKRSVFWTGGKVAVAVCIAFIAGIFSINAFTDGALAKGMVNIYNTIVNGQDEGEIQRGHDKLYVGNEIIYAEEYGSDKYWELGYNSNTKTYVVKLDFGTCCSKSTYGFGSGYSEEDKVWKVRAGIYTDVIDFIFTNQVSLETAVEVLTAMKNDVEYSFFKEGIGLAIEDLESGKNLIFHCEEVLDEENSTIDLIVLEGYAWYVVDSADLRFEEESDTTTVTMESVAGIKKNSEIEIKRLVSEYRDLYIVQNTEFISAEKIDEILR